MRRGRGGLPPSPPMMMGRGAGRGGREVVIEGGEGSGLGQSDGREFEGSS